MSSFWSLKYRALGVSVALLIPCLVSLPAATERMPLDEVRAGMTGVGVTVFEGTERVEFDVQVIGVLRNVAGPRRNLILARLEGGPLADTGVIQGMSGSPVYVDGRLIGAVAYSFGAFSKEPIAGITPIEEMIHAVAQPARRPPKSQRARLRLPVTREGLATVLRETVSGARPFAQRPGDVQAVGLPSTAGGQLGVMLRPIATPLVMGGFEADVMGLLTGALRDQGFVPVVSGSGGLTQDSGDPLQPGDAVGASLISGDLSMAATGTVTMVEEGRVYAFGHPFFNLGPTQFPMTRAYVHTLLPSIATSAKIATVGEVLGTFEQDRATAIAGTLGARPSLIPIRVSLDSPDRSRNETFTFQVVSDQLLTPLLTYTATLNTLISYAREAGAATFIVKGTTKVKGHSDVTLEDVFTGNAPLAGTATYIAAPIASLLTNDVEPVEIEAVDVSITALEQPQTATLERVWLDEVRPRAGRTVQLKVLTRTYRGEEITRTVPIDIPANASGRVSILVSDGVRLADRERRERRQPVQPLSIEQMIRELNKVRKNNRLYVRLLRADAGAVVNGETLSSLPPSVLAVLQAERNGGSFIPLRNATIGEWEITTQHAVSGLRQLTINLDAQ